MRGLSPFGHGHACFTLEETFHSLETSEAGSFYRLVHGNGGVMQKPFKFRHPPLGERLKDGRARVFPESEVGQSARASKVPDDIRDADALCGILPDVGESLSHQVGACHHGSRRLALDDLVYLHDQGTAS